VHTHKNRLYYSIVKFRIVNPVKFKSALFVLLIVLFGWCSQAHAQTQETRVALVIGNSNYKNAPLKNPVNDARDMASKLRGFGFTVIERNNLVVKQIGSTLREFRSKLTPGSVALIYYAGHGLQIKGDNYFPTVDADITGEEDVPNQSLAMKQIMDVLGDAKTRLNLVFLDACRNNPYSRSFRSGSDGLSKVNAPNGTLISFATRPGSVAADGVGRNGLYTWALLEAMDNKGQPIEQVLKRVVTSVKAGSRNQQEPWMEGSIEGEFCFGNCINFTQVGVSDDRALWESVKESRDVNELKVYLDQFPRGVFAGLANSRINSIEQSSLAQNVLTSSSVTVSQSRPLQAGSVFKDCEDCPEMVVIPSGVFMMGSKADPFSTSQPSADEQPQRSVSIKSFAMGKFEITQEQWFSLMGTMPSNFKGRKLPIENVSWKDAQEFVVKLSEKTGRNYRLPSEAEWEYSARAGNKTGYSFGENENEIRRFAWLRGNSDNTTHPVGEKLANGFGLHDMLGNVWEWTQDCWNRNYIGAPLDGSAWTNGSCSSRIMRGGSWFSYFEWSRVTNRNGYDPAVRDRYGGFRVARSM
jgi:formylglycine-generating enzyme required for sulfatase activity